MITLLSIVVLVLVFVIAFSNKKHKKENSELKCVIGCLDNKLSSLEKKFDMREQTIATHEESINEVKATCNYASIKAACIHDISQGESIVNVSEKYGIPASTLGGWKTPAKNNT